MMIQVQKEVDPLGLFMSRFFAVGVLSLFEPMLFKDSALDC